MENTPASTMVRLSSTTPRPTSPGSDPSTLTPGSSLGGMMKLPRLRTLPLVKWLGSACMGLMLLMFISQNSTNHLKELVHPAIGDTREAKEDPVPQVSIEQVHILHKRRRKAVQDVCRRNEKIPNKHELQPSMLSHIYVDDKHKFLYCMVPKVACTNFKRILLVLSGKVNTTSPLALEAGAVHSYLDNKLRTLDQYPMKAIKQRLKNFYKFMFVRDPLERVLSAYINKFTKNYNFYFHKRFGTRIVKGFRDNATTDSLMGGHDVTFHEFVRYLLKPSASEPLNEHWRHYYKLCAPCAVSYDAIGKYETMAQDIDYVLGEIGVNHLVQFPKGTAGAARGRTSTLVKQYYKNISSDQIQKLWEMYSVDYSMFGYPFPNVKNNDDQR